MWRKASFTLAFIVLALAGSVMLFASGPVVLTDGAFPDRTGVGIGLPDAPLAQEQRITQYWDDLLTPKITTRLYNNGEQGIDHHRRDGTIELRELFYPAAPDGTRQLKASAAIAPDGHTYVSDRGFHLNGKMQREGRLLPDGGYEVTTFYDDGLSTNARHLIGPKGEALYEALFRRDGTKISVAQQTHLLFDVTTYDEQERAIRTLSTSRYWTRDTIYYPDGVTKKREFLMDSYLTTASFFAPNGKVEQTRVFNSWQMIATFYEDGVPSYRQTWRLLTPNAVKPEDKREYQLIEAAVLNDSGNPSWRVTWDWTSKNVSMIEIGMDKASEDLVSTVTRKWYNRGTGFLELMLIKKGEYGPEVSRQTFTAEDAILPDEIPAYLLEPVDYEVPPKPVPPVMPSPWG